MATSDGQLTATLRDMEDNMESGVTVRYAESDQDVVAIHGFLCVVAGPTLPGPIDAQMSAAEVWRVCIEPDKNAPSFALMAIKEDRLVGTMGLVCVPFWWNNNLRHWANRWWFCLPSAHAGRALLREAESVAKGTDLELHIYAEERGSITILNRNLHRSKPSLANSPNISSAAVE